MKNNKFAIPNSLISSYIFSNTAFFLFDCFRNDPFIIFLSKEYSAEELHYFYNNISQYKYSDIEKIIISYALFISLLLCKDEKKIDLIKNTKINQLKWGESIKEIYYKSFIPTNFINSSIILNQDINVNKNNAVNNEFIYSNAIIVSKK